MDAKFGLVREAAGRAVLKAIPMPTLPDDYLLVRPVAIALNPTDWTTLDAEGDAGTIVGCDYAGVVVEVGKAVTRSFKKGDRVAGYSHGGNDANPQTGAFARYIIVKGDIQFHVPDGVGFEAACAIGSGVATTGYALYYILGFPYPDDAKKDEDRQILIYGGSTATGSIAIQFAKMSGYRVLTVCSPSNFELVKDRGADEVFDYRTAKVGEQIRAATHDSLTTVLDCVAVESSAAICAAAFGAKGGEYVNLLGVDCPRADVTSTFFLGYNLSGENYIFEGERYAAQPDVYAFAKRFVALAERLWAQGRWRPHPQQVNGGGLLGALDGMQQMREGRVSGKKLVYRVDETDWP